MHTAHNAFWTQESHIFKLLETLDEVFKPNYLRQLKRRKKDWIISLIKMKRKVEDRKSEVQQEKNSEESFLPQTTLTIWAQLSYP